jgi:hypothetical protein
MQPRARNTLIVLGGCVLLAGVVGFIDGKAQHAERDAPATKPAVPPAVPPAKPAKIFRMQAPLEELRKFPVIDGMARADELAWKALPQGLETAGAWVQREEVLEGYVHPNGKRFFVIMKEGDRAYSLFLD